MTYANLSKFYINGEWVAPLGGTTMGVENPATEEIVAQVALGTVADADRAILAARAVAKAAAEAVGEEIGRAAGRERVYHTVGRSRWAAAQ